MSTITHDSITNRYTSAPKFPGQWSLFRGLFLKECKQVLPLFVSLAGLIPVLHGLTAFIDGSDRRGWQQVVTFLFPLLYAIGCGVVLVGMEKESRTMRWLGSLPISRKWLVSTKFLVGVLSLSLIWLGSLSLAAVATPGVFRTGGMIDSNEWISSFVFNSYFLLIASFVSGWVFSSAWTSIVMIVPMAIVPAIGTNSVWLKGNSDSVAWNLLVDGLIYGVSAVVLLGLGYGFGRQTFYSPAKQWFLGWGRPRTAKFGTVSRSASWRPWSQFGALLWQSAWQNQMVWVAGGATLLIPVVTYLLLNRPSDSSILPIVYLIGMLVIAELGASVFASDGARNQIRFLSDRGVPLWKIWWSRMAAPILALFALVTMAFFVGPRLPDPPQNEPFGFVGLCVFLFAVNTWSTQWFRNAFLAYLAAPAVPIVFFAGVMTILSKVGIPPRDVAVAILFLSLSVIALIASTIMLKGWMEGRFDFTNKLQHAGLVLGCMIMVPVLYMIAFGVTEFGQR